MQVRYGCLKVNKAQHSVVMAVIKKEPGVDPLAIQSSYNTDADEKKPLSEEGNLLFLHVAGIKTEDVDHSSDLTSEIKVEETAVPTTFVTTKYKSEEELCDVDTVKDELKLEVTSEENKILISRCSRCWVCFLLGLITWMDFSEIFPNIKANVR
ncbi:uncharacterized protein [Periplaneta americana]|uniref:uncharacterized protein isoform X5 n=1 Tax=Periplaneta americana TaxID=6978 RepID=UPI0037E7B705